MLTEIGIGVVATKMVKDLKESDELNERAEKKRKRAYQNLSQAISEKMDAEEIMNEEVRKLIRRKEGILCSTIREFMDVYGQIKKIEFRETDGIKELDKFSLACCSEIDKQVMQIQQKDLSSSEITKNVIKGFLVGGLAGAITSSIVDDAQNNLNMAKDKARQSQVLAEQQSIYSASFKAISERAQRMREVLTKLNMCFLKSIKNTENIIREKGLERDKYETNDISQIGVCLNLAKAIKEILDTKILDQDFELTRASLLAIENGNQCLLNMQNALSNI
jgi:hypothetical protein